MPDRWVAWIVALVACYGVAALGSAFTFSSVKTWYPTLAKPVGTPPPWVFAPVWTVLYFLMATAAWLVWRHSPGPGVRVALALFVVQLALNAAWSFLFFRLRRPGLALCEILCLLGAIILTTISFSAISVPAAWLMVPYVAWVSYATYLNLGLWRLN